MFDNWTYFGFLASVITAVWTLAFWLNGHFNSIRREITDMGKDIISKLEYHERHDDQRFSQIRDDIWDIRVRNAAADGVLKPLKPNNREINANL